VVGKRRVLWEWGVVSSLAWSSGLSELISLVSFLWRYQHPSSKEDELEEGTLDVYKWTGRNDYVALCEPGFISFGGG
jgi:hypothetical protein